MKTNKIFKNMKIRTKLLAAFMVVALVTIAISIIALIDLTDTTKNSEQIDEKVIKALEYLTEATDNMVQMKLDGRNILISKDPEKQQAMIKNLYEHAGIITSELEKYAGTMLSSKAEEVYSSFKENFKIYIEKLADFETLVITEKDMEGAKEYLENTLSVISDKCLNDLRTMTDLKFERGKTISSEAISNSKFALAMVMVFFVVGLILTVVFGIYFSVSISKPLLIGAELMSKAADGDFTVKLPENYGAEIGQLFEACNLLNGYNYESVSGVTRVTKQLRELAQGMLEISSHMASNSKGLKEQTSVVSSATEEFSAGMTQSASSLSTASSNIAAVASSIEEINSTISTVAAAAEETSTRVQQSSTLVDSIQNSISTASGSVNLVSDAFNRVAESVDEINKSISIVSEHSVTAMNKMSDADDKAKNTNLIIQRLEIASKQIGKIVGVISDIADQTNMLALNAAIEAAGAGEAGKGFMVVANEVKELAKQTAEATDEIAEQIENMQKNMPEAVGAVSEITAIINGMAEFMNSFAQEIKQQGKRSDQINSESAAAARRMNEITTEINRISENALSVTKTVIESTKGVDEIARSTAELVIGSQEIAMNSERASNNISEINRAAKEMAAGLIEISKNLQLINSESGQVRESADLTKHSSEELLKTANGLEVFISKFKVT